MTNVGGVGIEIVGDARKFEEAIEKSMKRADAFAEAIGKTAGVLHSVESASTKQATSYQSDANRSQSAARATGEAIREQATAVKEFESASDRQAASFVAAAASAQSAARSTGNAIQEQVTAVKEVELASRQQAETMQQNAEVSVQATRRMSSEMEMMVDAINRQAEADKASVESYNQNAEERVSSIEKVKEAVEGLADVTQQSAQERRATEEEARRAAEDAAEAEQNRLQAISDALQDLGTTATGVFAAISIAIGLAEKKANDFEEKVASLAAISGASAAEIQKSANAAMSMAPNLGQSPTKGVETLEEFSKAGVELARLYKGELKDAMALTVSGEIEVGDAAEYAASSFANYKDEMLTLKDISNVAVGAANASSTSVKEMAEANSQLGNVAKILGFNFRDVNTQFALMAQNGLKGSDGATSMKTFFLAIANPTKESGDLMKKLGLSFFDASGKAKSFVEMSDMLRAKLSRFNEQSQAAIMSQIAGSDGIRFMSALMKQTGDDWNKMTADMSKASSMGVAEGKLDSVNGQLKKLSASTEVAAIGFSEGISPAMSGVVSIATEAVDAFNKLDASTKGTIGTVTATGTAMIGTAAAVSLLTVGFGRLGASVKAAGGAMAILNTNPLIAALTVLVGISTAVYMSFERNAQAAKKFSDAQDELNKKIAEVAVTKDPGTYKESRDEAKQIEELGKKHDELTKKKDELLQKHMELIKAHREQSKEASALRSQMGDLDKQLAKNNASLTELGLSGDNWKQKLEELRAAYFSNTSAGLESIKTDVDKLVTLQDSINKIEDAQQAYKSLSAEENLNAEQKAKLNDAVTALKSQIPGLNTLQLENGKIIIQNTDLIGDKIRALKDEKKTTEDTTNATLNSLKVEAEERVKSYTVQIEAIRELAKAQQALNHDGNTGNDIEIPTNVAKRQQAYLEKAESVVATSKVNIAAIEDAYNRIKNGTPYSAPTPPSSGSDVFTPDTNEKKGKSAEELAREADAARRASFERDMAYSKQLLTTGEINEEGYVDRLKGIRGSYSDWLAKNSSDLFSLINEIEHQSFGYSEGWIKDKKQSMIESGASTLEIARMEEEAWARVANRQGLLAEDRKKAEEEYRRASKEAKSADFAESENWIAQYQKTSRDAGLTDIEIAKGVYDAWARVNAKKAQYNPEDQIKVTEQLREATIELENQIESALRKAREMDRDKDMAALEEQFKSELEAQQSKLDGLEKEATATKYLIDLERERQRLADLEDQRNKVAADVRFEIIDVDASGNLVKKRTADTARLTELDKQIADQKTRIGDMQRDEENRKQREQYDKEMKELRDSQDKKKAAHEAYWKDLLSSERINSDTRAAVQKNGLDTTLANVKTYLKLIQDEYTKKQGEIMAAGGLIPASSTGSFIGGGGSSVDFTAIQAQMAANSAAWGQATSQAERDRLHDENTKLGSGAGGVYDDKTGKWSFPKLHTGIDRVPGLPGAEPTFTLEAGERVLSVSGNETYEAYMQSAMSRQTSIDSIMSAAVSSFREASSPQAMPQDVYAAGAGGARIVQPQFNMPLNVTKGMDAQDFDRMWKQQGNDVWELINSVGQLEDDK
ncbi:phage tail tape measure protein [Tumebacillus permanentifrigoris]|nr:phage tail tape measure protein [Tumebacillus permanentifrigoris]